MWEESPFVKGYITDQFLVGLVVMCGISLLITVIATAITFKKKLEAHGTAAWASDSRMVKVGYFKKYKDITGPIFGKTSKPEATGKYLTNGPQPHTLVSAPTRAGKGVGVVIPTMLTHNGSSIVLDVKGELFESTSRARLAKGDEVFKFSPIDPESRTHRYNPLDDIVNTPPHRRFVEARRLATNLVVAKNQGAEGFIDGARDLFVAGILIAIERGTPTIGAVYDLFSLPGEKYQIFAQFAEETKVPEARRIFDNMAGNDNKILTSYTSVLGDGGLNLWADQLVKNATEKSDFNINNLRRHPTCVFIVVSPNDLEVLAPLVRLLFQQIVSLLQRTLPADDEVFEVLFLLDEFKHLGKMSAIETAITTIAGYGGRFMFIIQTISALTENYGQSGKENFLGNTGLQVFMATADAETPEYISKAIGDYTRKSRSKSWNNFEIFRSNVQEREEGSRLIRPEQIRLLDEEKQIILIKGEPPILMPKVRFYKDKILKKLFENQTGDLPHPPPLKTIVQEFNEPAPDLKQEAAKHDDAAQQNEAYIQPHGHHDHEMNPNVVHGIENPVPHPIEEPYLIRREIPLQMAQSDAQMSSQPATEISNEMSHVSTGEFSSQHQKNMELAPELSSINHPPDDDPKNEIITSQLDLLSRIENLKNKVNQIDIL